MSNYPNSYHSDKSNEVHFNFLKNKALELRKTCVKISSSKKIPHLGSCLSCADILTVLYWDSLNIDPEDPNKRNRDRFLLSKGHASPIYLQLLSQRGFFPESDLELFGKDGSFFHEHPPKPGYINGVEAATGSLGHGFSMGLGMAKAAKIQGDDNKVFVLLGDGECNEGVIWECAMLAPKIDVGNLIAIIDYNKLQATGRSQDITSIDPLDSKWNSFGWHTQTIDGHNVQEIKDAIDTAISVTEAPSMIVANTVKGKGISFMEDDNNWHYRTPNAEELSSAFKELEETL